MTLRTLPMLAVRFALGSAATPGPAVEKQRRSLDVNYTVDDGDYRVVFKADAKGERSQVVSVRSPVESCGSLWIRGVWSPGYAAGTEAFPTAIANRLPESSQDKKPGGWVRQGDFAVFVVEIDAAASAQELRVAREVAAEIADEMEAELHPGKDTL